MAKTHTEKEYVQLPEELHYVSEYGTATKFNRVYAGHRFTDDEVLALKRGETITITATRDGRSFPVTGALAGQTFTTDDGRHVAFIGFQAKVDTSVYAVGNWVHRPGRETKFRRLYKPAGGHSFTEEETARLFAGEKISFTTDGGTAVTGVLAELSFTTDDGREVKYVGFEADDPGTHFTGEWVGRPGKQTRFKRSFSGYDFTDQDCQDLLAGQMIGFIGTKRNGDSWEVNGKLAELTFDKDGQSIAYVGFEPDFGDRD